MSTTKFTHKISRSSQGSYYTIPFTVPENIVKLTVSYEYYRPTKGFLADLKPSNTIDIGLSDETRRFLGWSGNAYSSISVDEYGSSHGYLCEKINPGEWGIIVGAYHVMPEGVEVKYTVEFEEKKPLWLFGDLHVHSNASDGSLDAHDIGKLARKRRLDFNALANHNNFAENLHLPHEEDFTFVPAVEWTHYNGHMNFFGVPAPFENSFIANTGEDMKKIIEHARSLGAVISVNHPKCRFCPYKWEDEESFDMVEIWNGPMRKTNTDGIEWWTVLLRAGRRLPAVGGSDFHGPGGIPKLGNPVTAVFSASRSAGDIVSAISKGHAFVTSGINGVKLNLTYGEAGLGDEARYNKDTPLKVSIHAAGGSDILLVTDKDEQLLKKNVKGDIVFEAPVEETRFAYIKAVRGTSGKICAVTNPIYFK